jgi:hypothetical protein
MSSGLTGDFSFEGPPFTGFGDGRFWAGDNGKIEILPSGKVRSKWNSYALKKGFRRRPVGTFTGIRLSDGSSFTVQCDCNFSITPEFHSVNLELKAQSKLVDKIRGHSFNLAVNAAQSRQLVDMVVGNLGKLGRSILALKRGDFATAARQLGASPRTTRLKASDISGRWLELQYGWLPTLSDTFAAAEAYEELTKEERSMTFRVSASEEREFEQYAGWGAGTSTGQFHSFKTQRQTISIVAELTETLSASRSLGLTDPLSVAWEVIPYSFVVDWFIPIGTFLDNLAIIPFLQGRFMTTNCWRTSGNTHPVYVGTFPCVFGGELVSDIQILDYSDQGRGWYLTRQVASSLGLQVVYPQFDSSGLHGKRIWNAIALASQRFKG